MPLTAIRELVLPSGPSVTDEVMEQIYFLLIRRVVVGANGQLEIQWTFEPHENVKVS